MNWIVLLIRCVLSGFVTGTAALRVVFVAFLALHAESSDFAVISALPLVALCADWFTHNSALPVARRKASARCAAVAITKRMTIGGLSISSSSSK